MCSYSVHMLLRYTSRIVCVFFLSRSTSDEFSVSLLFQMLNLVPPSQQSVSGYRAISFIGFNSLLGTFCESLLSEEESGCLARLLC